MTRSQMEQVFLVGIISIGMLKVNANDVISDKDNKG